MIILNIRNPFHDYVKICVRDGHGVDHPETVTPGGPPQPLEYDETGRLEFKATLGFSEQLICSVSLIFTQGGHLTVQDYSEHPMFDSKFREIGLYQVDVHLRYAQ